MTRYIDTSVLVGALAREARAAELQAWLTAQADVTVSWWNGVEFASAVSRKIRERRYTAAEGELLTVGYDQLIASAFDLLPIGPDDILRARQFTAQPHAGLRASDALHLAVAAGHGLEVVTLDRRMAAGGTAVGVATLLL